MKRIFLFTLLGVLISGMAAFSAEKIEPPKECKQCGMDRVAFAHGRMLIIFADGTSVATCSLNCATMEMKANGKKRVKLLMVADYGTKKLINAEKAFWVLGGKRPGIMTEMPKWAFARKEDAQKFVEENGGRVATFDEALNLALRENE